MKVKYKHLLTTVAAFCDYKFLKTSKRLWRSSFMQKVEPIFFIFFCMVCVEQYGLVAELIGIYLVNLLAFIYAFFSDASHTAASVVIINEDTLAASTKALFTTFNGSTIPAAIMSFIVCETAS